MIKEPDELADRIFAYRKHVAETGDPTLPWMPDIHDGEWHKLELSWSHSGVRSVSVDGIEINKDAAQSVSMSNLDYLCQGTGPRCVQCGCQIPDGGSVCPNVGDVERVHEVARELHDK